MQVDVTTQAGCAWTSQSGIESGCGFRPMPKTGSGRVEVSVLPNGGSARSAAIVVAGQSVTYRTARGAGLQFHSHAWLVERVSLRRL